MNSVKLFLKICFGLTLWSPLSFAENYCMAIRGNGELMPAHWGAMAETIETFGVPQGVAGGSSASISAMLLESVLMNPMVHQAQSIKEKSRISSYLIKSFQGFTYALAEQPEWKSILDLTVKFQSQNIPKNQSQLENIKNIILTTQNELSAKDLIVIKNALVSVQESQLFYGPALASIFKTLQNSDLTITTQKSLLLAQLDQAQKSLRVFGEFNAKDPALFVRSGIINFKALARLFGRMGAFYAQTDSSQKDITHWKVQQQNCIKTSDGLSWDELIAKNPNCQLQLADWIHHYFEAHPNTYRTQDNVGQYLPALITTAIVDGASVATLQKQKQFFETTFDELAAEILDLAPQDLHFGYWGAANDLAKVKSHLNLFPIDKSQRFLSLGTAPWELVLSLSPAEPGLSAMNFFTNPDGRELVSLGGWSDLHPTAVLKAMGCPQVVYITRMGGDSMFSQGVAKRLFKMDDKTISWEALDSKNTSSLAANDGGNRADQESLWSNMYNLANPKSSYAGSLLLADAVVCTHWNSFNIKKDFKTMIEEAYRAPIYNPSHMTPLLDGAPLDRAPQWITPLDNSANAQGVPAYAGCIPL